MTRSFLLCAALAAMLGSLGSCSRPGETDTDRPNVLLIVLDTLRSDVLGCYGHQGALTPRIDRFAGEGTLYTRFYATDFWTLPSHASLLTGLYPTQCQATSETNHLPGGVTTLAERLSDAGYRTGAVVHNPWVSRERGFAQGFEDFVEVWRMHASSNLELERAGRRQAVDWIADHADSPFFLMVNFNIAHMPYAPDPQVFDRIRTRDWPARRVKRLRRVSGMWPYLAGRLRLSEADFQILRDLYESVVVHADELVGGILDAVDRAGIAENTLVIVTSDHGENLGEHGLIDHTLSMHETTLHIPLIVRYPPRFEAGRRVDDLSSLVDIVPTVLDVCGLPPADHGDILPLGRNLTDENAAPPEYVVAENDRPINGVELMKAKCPEFDVSTIDLRIRTLITPRYKLVWHLTDRTELYDLVADPGELTDVSGEKAELRRRMQATLEQWTGIVTRSLEPVGPFRADDSATRQRLRGHGYVK